ncbi:hypothetical protein [Microbacterium aurantiacum]|uniref:hypothetical protein n=1 Tax=Microbacterium aurantiacum TaxID=162393 RepID=UPI000C800E04|nr:hypothetical protein [Microbacterium aurantiacum]
MSELIEERSFTVEAARAAVLASNELEAFEGPHFRAGRDGAWDSVFLRDEEHPHPDFARVIVTRRGQAPREVTIGWADYAEIIAGADEARTASEREWVATRGRKPMTIFGSEAERHGYRVVFADILAPLLGGSVRRAATPASQAAEPGRDFAAEIRAAETVEQIDAIDTAIRAVRGFAPNKTGTDLHRLWKDRRREILDVAWAPEPEAVVADWPVDHVEDVEPGAAPRAVPRDHLAPQNRAGRRAAARKKGGRR